MTENWTSHIYRDDSLLPLVGELIKVRYSIADLDYPYGPTSTGSLGSRPTAVRRQDKLPFHHVVVSAAAPAFSGGISLQFFPVVSYSRPPPGFTGADWNPAAWMLTQPPSVTLRHLPIPASGWTPSAPALWGTNPLDFGPWMNDRPSWVTIQPRLHTIAGSETWKRLSPTVHLSAPDLTTLRQYQANVAVHFMQGNPDVTVNYTSVPEHHVVWADIYSEASTGYVCRDEDDEDNDDARSDGIDPVNFWRYKGAPADMQEMVRQSDKEVMRCMKLGVSRWAQAVDLACGDVDESDETDRE